MISTTGSRQAGFSLIELLVVLSILALTAALVSPALDRALQSARLKGATRELASALRQTRGQAIHRGLPARFILDTHQRRYRVGQRNARTLHQELALTMIIAKVERNSEHEGGIRFYPDGSSTGGRVTLNNPAGAFDIDVHWLTGQVRITP